MTVFVIIPSFKPTGPIRGAIALCNFLSNKMSVVIVPLKASSESQGLFINKAVRILELSAHSNWIDKYKEYCREIRAAQKIGRVVSLSMCFSADFFNTLFRKKVTIVSSVRGNLIENYRFDSGFMGYLKAYFHYMLLRRFAAVVAMSDIMKEQLQSFGIRKISVIPNFIDETYLETFRVNHILSDCVGIVFLGSLSRRKRPELLIDIFKKINAVKNKAILHLIGDGPLRSNLADMLRSTSVESSVKFHGQIDRPYEILQSADVMVLPSESEGISRAVMEAMFFGIPCILRNVDANSELIDSKERGYLFENDADLAILLSDIVDKRKLLGRKNHSILSERFSLTYCGNKYLGLLKDV
jgi:glycosyltransferase involved in cell wall biosynthesis